MSHPDWDHLRVFLAVARAGQILGAANRLGLNHATVGRQITALETSLGTALIERHSTGCTLTPAGERLRSSTEEMEAEFLRVQSDLSGAAESVSGTVRVGAPDGIGNYFLAPALSSLASRHPDLVVELAPLPRTFSLSRREADIAISLDRPAHGKLIVKKLTDYTLSVYATKTYLAARGEPASLDDLAGHVVISGIEELSYSSALRYSEALTRTAGMQFSCASISGQLEAIRSGNGIGIVHDYVANGMPDLVRLLPDVRFRRTYWIISHADTHQSRRIAAVYRFIVDRISATRAIFDADS
ncbi:CysJI operon transcriptional activator [Hartmannibacter diazotrophicus]|uniref:CysJI operon transcriptional activator n=1 Tax=Hartmannibacter diazotrophicus TaxID=1482074 RepID=A0A2C9D2I9_9HYPH|nr:LysR family transcriptional regulator [Hartmannibacter diazotrophicus]SON54443.1 CysJI operon transcriptional activator [Hartmannibacter diazotrophicus]